MGSPSTLQAADGAPTVLWIAVRLTEGCCPPTVGQCDGALMALLPGGVRSGWNPVPSPLPGPTLTLLWGLGLWQERGGRPPWLTFPIHTSPETEEGCSGRPPPRGAGAESHGAFRGGLGVAGLGWERRKGVKEMSSGLWAGGRLRLLGPRHLLPRLLFNFICAKAENQEGLHGVGQEKQEGRRAQSPLPLLWIGSFKHAGVLSSEGDADGAASRLRSEPRRRESVCLVYLHFSSNSWPNQHG